MTEPAKRLHAMLSPSGTHKWMTCTGSIAMEQGQPDDSSEYADEGTAAHSLAAMCLEEDQHPAAYLGRVLTVMNGVYFPGDGPKPDKLRGHTQDITREFEVDGEMVAAINTYTRSVRQFAGGSGEPGEKLPHPLHVEQRVPIGYLTGEEDAEGTSDAVILNIAQAEIQVHDLKFGRGVVVKAENNEQLMTYMAGARRKFAGMCEFTHFRGVIHQPRLNSVSEWDWNLMTQLDFEKRLSDRAQTATRAVMNFPQWKDGGPLMAVYLVPGDHCRTGFCKAKATCPALANLVKETIGADFEVLDEVQEIARAMPKKAGQAHIAESVVALLPVDPVELGRRMLLVDLVDDWCRAIRGKVDAMLRSGEEVPNWKLVIGKRGNRAWVDEEAATTALKKMRLKVEEMYSMKLITPTAAEKLLADQPKRLATVMALVTQADGKPSVAHVSDNRAEWSPKPVADDFPDIDTGEDLV